ncbi:ribokinase [Kaistia dalseonensis]|uniref:Ribokinase n=1 Tax=Kaistia dalseonensis TaxID=410840 RepID=A0ABU0H6I8_9HYPH|nr:ribokinase [Kaistia dalseonensis]MCX5494549.1 ribokinase [Kaistia dalseonensis]MDQ0437129.1 ribokinase [Kaistia dalseonensis]
MITIFGSINIDLVCRTAHLPRPGETVPGSDYQLIAGGKGANQALAARRAGAAVRLVGAVGADDMAAIALSELNAAGTDLASVVTRGPTTGMAIITVDQHAENTIVLSPGANARLVASDLGEGRLGEGDTLLLQMEVPFAESLEAARRAKAAGARVMLSIAPFLPVERAALVDVDIILVNETEAGDLARHLGLPVGPDGAATVATLAEALQRTVIATLGADGAVAAHQGETIRVASLPVVPVDTTGAGDTFAGVTAALLDQGEPLSVAMQYAAVAGALACTREGAQPSFPLRGAIDEALAAVPSFP